ncbi:VSP [Giardia lamblia P15]|uniref:VSP n=1 Tax=Giardia intestinalis (strain P15) TaxID=658858 RepID=E1EXL8_GIAIA|nr:VSP [Giardia lamblia P15]
MALTVAQQPADPMFGRFVLVGSIVQLAWAAQAAGKAEPAACADETGKCATCDVLIGDKLYCSTCKAEATNHAPVNGVCKDVSSDTAVCKTNAGGKCTECNGQSFMYKDGCYSKDTAPGNTMCSQAAEGKCSAPDNKKNYFVVPEAERKPTEQSVVWCGDPMGVTLKSGQTYKGVDGCTTCEGSPLQAGASGIAVCNACGRDESGAERIVRTATDQATSCVTEAQCIAEEGFFVNTVAGKKCSACEDENCAVCMATGNGKCTRCKDTDKKYLKKGDQSETGTCVTEAECKSGDTHFTDDTGISANGALCRKCAEGGLKDCDKCEKPAGELVCKECTGQKFGLSKKSCVAECPASSAERSGVCTCDDGFEPDSTFTSCQPKSSCRTLGCKTCTGEGTDKEVCTACFEGKYLTPTNQCVPDCTVIEGYYNDRTANRCEKCNSNCKTCLAADGDKCTSCPAGRALTYEAGDPTRGGTCGDACKVSADGTGCETCGAQIGGTAYCSKCKDTQQAPLDGNCAANARVAFCAIVTGGACTKCNEGYFLKDGGCYQTDRQPGKQVCSSTVGGKCTKCASGIDATDGDCSTRKCHESCETCTTANDPNACTTCNTGYYRPQNVGTKCNPCSEGLTGCRQCTASSNAFMCLEMGDSTVDGESTNKSGLSTGAIAGIAVAVVIVIGGLIGFLCWWFICRGKA